MASDLKLGVTFGYWGKGPRPDLTDAIKMADDCGVDSIWTAESWGNDAFTFATWVAVFAAAVTFELLLLLPLQASMNAAVPDSPVPISVRRPSRRHRVRRGRASGGRRRRDP